MIKKNAKLLVVLGLLCLFGGVVFAVFGDRADVLGTSVSVGSADLKLLNSLSQGIDSSNLVDSKAGPVFSNIYPNWFQDYGVKIFNNGNSTLTLSSYSDYVTANDPDELRQVLFVEPFVWDDVNNDGVVTDSELGTSFGKKTIVKWKTEGYTLNDLSSGEVASYVLRFSTESIPDSKQGTSGVFDFYFDSLSE